MQNKIKDLIKNGYLEKAIEKAIEASNNKSIRDQLITASFQLKDISRQFNSGVIKAGKVSRDRLKIASLILSLIQEDGNKYKTEFERWIKTEFENAKEIKFDVKITPKLIIDCYVEDCDGDKLIFTLNKEHIENLKDSIKNVYQVIWANEFLYISIDDHDEAELYINFFCNDSECDDIMDIYEIDDIDVLKCEINENGEFISPRSFKAEDD